MAIIEGTPEQLATLTREKTRVVREHTSDIIDTVTGTVLKSETTQDKMTSTEPDYIKVYYRTVLAFNGITDIPVPFLLAISSCMTWVTAAEPMYYKSDKLTRDTVCKQLGIGEQMYKRYLTRCTESGLLIKKPGYRGVYDVNPLFIAKGRWQDIAEVRATFEFRGGRWSRTISEEDHNEGTDRQ